MQGNHYPMEGRRASRPTLLVTFTPDVRVSLVCADPVERRRLGSLVALVEHVVNAALARAGAGAA